MTSSLCHKFENGWRLEVTCLDDLVWRVLYTPPEGLRTPKLWNLVTNEGLNPPQDGLDRATLGKRAIQAPHDNSRISCAVDPASGKLTWYRDGKWIAADRQHGDAVRFAGQSNTRALDHFMVMHDDDWICGLGDKTGAVNQAGRRFRLAARDALGFKHDTDPLYKHWPFWHVRTKAGGTEPQFYAQLYLNQSEGAVDFGCERSGYYIETGKTYRTWQAEGGDLDYLMFFGDTPQENLDLFYKFTGKPLVRPDWACGFQFTSMAIPDADKPEAEIEKLLTNFKQHDIPLDAFHFGSGYSRHGERRMAMTWNRERFPDPQATLDRIRSENLHVAANIKPSIFTDHPEFDALAKAGTFIKNSDGEICLVRNWDGQAALLDFSNPTAIDWWQTAAKERILSTGIEVIWNDNNEYELWDTKASCDTFGQPSKFSDLRTGLSLLMCAASKEAQKDQPQHHSITRSAVPGCQRYAETWSGDNFTSWRDFKASLQQTNVMALSGLVVTGHDVGGFYGPSPTPELLLRYIQAYCLLPRFVMNSWKPDTEITFPWMHSEVTQQIRQAIKLRYHLMPYLLQLEKEGRWLRAPQMAFPDDENLYALDNDTFMVGDILVAPVVDQGAETRSVYLPVSDKPWQDLWSGGVYEGGQSQEWPVNLDSLPLFAPVDLEIPVWLRPGNRIADMKPPFDMWAPKRDLSA